MKRLIAKTLCIISALVAEAGAAEYTEEQQAMQYLLIAEGVISSPEEINERMAYLMNKNRDWHDIKRLLEAGANPNEGELDSTQPKESKQNLQHNRSYLYKCIKASEDVRLMYMLLDAGAHVNVPLPDNLTILHHIAVSFNKFKKMNPTQWQEFLDLLIEKGLNINQQTGEGITALMIAAKNANLDLVQYLVAKGADTSLRVDKGHRAIDFVPKDNDDSPQIRQILQSAEPAL